MCVSVIFLLQLRNIEMSINRVCGNTAAHLISFLNQRITPNLCTNVTNGHPGYTSNNAESMNHVLKNATGWRVHKLPDLINNIKNIVTAQYRDSERAIYGEGSYTLQPNLRSRFLVAYDDWAEMTEQQRIRRLKLCYQLPSSNTVSTSSNGKLTVAQSPRGGRKLNQRKRPPNERTSSNSKRRRV